MNAGEILDAVGVELGHDPSGTERRNRLKQLDRIYRNLVATHPWKFAQKLRTIRVWPDLALPTAAVTISGHSVVVAAGLTLTTVHLYDNHLEYPYTGAAVYMDDVFQGYIERLVSGQFWLDRPARATTGTVALTLKQERILLPWDCVDVLSMVDRSTDAYGPLQMISLAQEQHLMLNEGRDTAERPAVYLLDPPNDNPPAPFRGDQVTLTAALASSASGLTVGVAYSYCVMQWAGGKLSGRSPIVTATPTTGNRHITLSPFQDVSGARGFYRLIFRQDGVDAPFHCIAVLASDELTTSTTWKDTGASAGVSQWDPQKGKGGERVLDPDIAHVATSPLVDINHWRYMRVYPRLPEQATLALANAAVVELQMRYQRRAMPLLRENDEPIFPPEHHEVLLYALASDIAARYEDPARGQIRWLQQTYQERLTWMRRKELNETGITRRFSMWTSASPPGSPVRPVITKL